MRIVYLLSIDILKYEGVLKKIVSKIRSWEEKGNFVQLIVISPSQNSRSVIHTLKNVTYVHEPRFKRVPYHFLIDWLSLSRIYNRVLRGIRGVNPDLLYYRNFIFCPFKNRIHNEFVCVAELNTYEKREFQLQAKVKFTYRFFNLYFKLTEHLHFKGVRGFVTVTNEIASLMNIKGTKVPCLVAPNSIKLDGMTYVPKRENPIPRVAFIATPGLPWHGFDILQKLAQQTINELHFDIIGLDQEGENVSNNMFFHGYKTYQEYAPILYGCDIGISSLALYRNGLSEACPLKTREYLSFGLPIILSYKDTAFIGKKHPDWLLQLPAGEDSILSSTKSIVEFCKRFQNTRLTKEDIAEFVDSEILENERLNFMRIVSENRSK